MLTLSAFPGEPSNRLHVPKLNSSLLRTHQSLESGVFFRAFWWLRPMLKTIQLFLRLELEGIIRFRRVARDAPTNESLAARYQVILHTQRSLHSSPIITLMRPARAPPAVADGKSVYPASHYEWREANNKGGARRFAL